MSKLLLLILLAAAGILGGCAGYRPDEVHFNDVLVARSSLLATLAAEDAAADAKLLPPPPQAHEIRLRLRRKAALAGQVSALAAALYERTHHRTLSPGELARLIQKYKEADPCPRSQPSR